MKAAAAVGAILALGLVASPARATDAPRGDATRHVERATQLLSGEHASEAQFKEGFLHLLDALLAVAPTSGGPAWPAKVAKARARIEGGSLVDPAALRLLDECYRETHRAAGFRMPDEVRTIADARVYVQRTLASASESLVKGDDDEGARRLLTAAVAIVTPMSR